MAQSHVPVQEEILGMTGQLSGSRLQVSSQEIKPDATSSAGSPDPRTDKSRSGTRDWESGNHTKECPICEYPRARFRYRMRDRFFEVSSDEFLLYHCSSCGLLFQDEGRIKDRIHGFYPSGYWWEASGRLSQLEGTYREWVVRRDQLRFLVSVEPSSDRRRLLDIGCGGGTFVKLANREGFEAFGLEQSQEAACIADRQSPGKIFQGFEQDLIAAGEKFDILTLFHSLEHMTDPFRYLKKLRNLLREEGTLIVQVPNVQSLQARFFGSRWYGLDCPRHVYNYSTFSLLHVLGRAGYRIQQVRHFSLRDNSAAFVSSLFPFLDPMSQRVKLLRSKGQVDSWGLWFKRSVYVALLVLAQPFALLEAGVGRGGTVTVCATID